MNTKILFFHAEWDGNSELYDEIFSLCRKKGVYFDGVDCDNEKGVLASIKYGVKLCPYIIALLDGKEVWRGIANDFPLHILDCLR